MSLLACQAAFRDEIIAADDGAPPSSLGMEIYRDAYRGRLLAALEVSFERTRRWVGDAAFTAAACHYILTHPPKGWTLDNYGGGFPDIVASLFTSDAEVAELAWLEWQMQQAFAAKDLPRLDPAELVAAHYNEADWAGMHFTMAAGFAIRPMTTNCIALWTALADAEADGFPVEQDLNNAVAVWRNGLSPHFRMLDPNEAAALANIAAGVTFGIVAEHCDGEMLGKWLAQWLSEGILSTASTTSSPRRDRISPANS